jgi:glyoxylase-like metal-dependent hydrolase (beta-lactamase superfamily II)
MSKEPRTEPEEILADARSRGIHCLPVPTPFAVGRVNCYLVEGDRLVLIDAGPNSERSLAELDAMIEAAGHSMEDIDLVIATHQHIDHIGLIRTVAEQSGAEVAALDRAVVRLGDFGLNADAEDDMAVSLMLRHGISEEIANTLRAVSSTYRDFGDRVEVTTPLTAGETIEIGGMDMEIHHRPGHSPSDTIFFDPASGTTFGGDHLLSHISSNPLIARPLDGSDDRTRSLIDYTESLLRTREMDISVMFSGHGDPVTDHRSLIDSRLAAQDRRREKIFGIIEEGPKSAHQIAEAIWGDVAVTQAYLTLSEVVGHVDVLLEQGRVEELSDGDLILFGASR